MTKKSRKSFMTILLVGVISLSAIITSPVYADEALPPESAPIETVDTGVEQQPTPEEEAPPPAEGIVDIPIETSTMLEQLPENTEIIVLDEEGEVLPLVTEEAQTAIMEGDPMWCPVGVTPGGAGCTASTTSFATMLTNLTGMYGAGGPSMAGVIWISQSYNSNTHDFGVTNFTLNGDAGFLENMSAFALTIQGGWTDIGKGISTTNTSEFVGASLNIINWQGAVTVNNITVSGVTGTGLFIVTAGNVTINNSQFNNNTSSGFSVINQGTITVKDATANSNTAYGAVLDNDGAITPKAVTLTGTNTFNGNGFDGLYIATKGIVTANNLTANNNSGYGLQVDNNVDASVPNGVTLTGTNIFGDNNLDGLYIVSFGPVTINNLIANSNTVMGANITNSGSNTAQAVKLTGTSEFKYNSIFGLFIASKGAITLNNITANTNGQIGVSLNNNDGVASNVTMTGTNQFKFNGWSGLNITSIGAVALNNLTADDNGTSATTGYGVSISNQTAGNFKPVTITGTNSFNDNYYAGLNIFSSGIITLNNITATGSQTQQGTILNNLASTASAPKAIVINGTRNTFSNNYQTGLQINSYGAITLNNITAKSNGLGVMALVRFGAYIDNSGSTTPQKVTINGTNVFQSNYDTGLLITTKGAVLTNSVNASYNQQGKGAEINNSTGTATSSVTMTGTNLFSNNNSDNLTIYSTGAITLNNITAEYSVNGKGASISNLYGTATNGVTLTGTNNFSGNSGSSGVEITSYGVITTNNLYAGSNGNGANEYGAFLYNLTSPIKAGVNVNGINGFEGNAEDGLRILSLGNVKVNSVTAQNNGESGLEVDGTLITNTGTFTLTGTNDFSYNGQGGLKVRVYGAVTLNTIKATFNTGTGAEINNTYSGTSTPKPVTLLGTNSFTNNTQQGISIQSHGAITTNNITAKSNTNIGVDLINNTATTPAKVTLNGINLFENNSDGLFVQSNGSITVSNITSKNNSSGGAVLINNGVGSTTASSVIVKGTNLIDGNTLAGFNIVSKGAITINNLTANDTANGHGLLLDNTASGSATPKAITLTGTNAINSNSDNGLVIDSYGSVTINNLTANDNGWAMGVNGTGVDINNYQAGATIAANVTLTGYTTVNNNDRIGVYIDSFGTIKIHNLTAIENGTGTSSSGVYLDNSNALSNAFGVTLSGNTITTANGLKGLEIKTKGAVLLNNVTSTDNSQIGLSIDNTYSGSSTPKPVTLTGVNNISNNSNTGFGINSYGVVTLNKITANFNTGLGGGIDNASATVTPANVVVLGYGVFNGNSSNGLLVNSLGAVTVNNITANNNTFSGLDINNSTGTGSVMLNGVNNFANNGDNGVTILSSGAVSITKIASDGNSQSGLVVTTTGAVTITCGSLNYNTMYGWEVYTATLVTTKGVFTGANTLGDKLTVSPVVASRACPLP